MSLPSLQDQFAALIATPSVSCTQPHWDQSNREKKIINQLVLEGRFSREQLHAELGEIVIGEKDAEFLLAQIVDRIGRVLLCAEIVANCIGPQKSGSETRLRSRRMRQRENTAVP